MTEYVQVTMKAIYDNEVDYDVQAGGHSAMKGWMEQVSNVFKINIFENIIS